MKYSTNLSPDWKMKLITQMVTLCDAQHSGINRLLHLLITPCWKNVYQLCSDSALQLLLRVFPLNVKYKSTKYLDNIGLSFFISDCSCTYIQQEIKLIISIIFQSLSPFVKCSVFWSTTTFFRTIYALTNFLTLHFITRGSPLKTSNIDP